MRVIKRTLKIFAYLGTGTLVLIVLLAAFTQTDFFKDRLRRYLISEVSQQLNGTLILGRVDGNLLSGFILDSLEVYYGGQQVIGAHRVLASYDPFTLFRQEASIRFLIFEQPTVHAIRFSDGSWNILKVLKPSTDTTASGAFDWNILVNDIQLKHASVTIIDSTRIGDSILSRKPSINFGNLALRDLNAQMSAAYRAEDLALTIKHVSGYATNPRFELTHLRGQIEASGNGVNVRDLIIQTSQSYLELDGAIDGLNIFRPISPEQLGRDSVRIELAAKSIDFDELAMFIPQTSFLDGSSSLALDASGLYGNLVVRRLNVRSSQSEINISGALKNLHTPNDLYLDLIIGDSRIHGSDVTSLLPTLVPPELKQLPPTTLYATFTGKPLAFQTTGSVRSDNGMLEWDGSLNLRQHPAKYDARFTMRDFSLAPFVSAPEWNPVLNARGELDGQGFSLNELEGTFALMLDSSVVRQIRLASANINLRAKDHTIEGSLTLSGEEMKTTFTGTVNLPPKGEPHYAGDFSFLTVNLGRLLNDPKLESNLTMQGRFEMAGKNIDDLSGSASFSLLPSVFNAHELGPEDIHFTLEQNDPDNKHLGLTSSVADLTLDGRFDLDLISAAITAQSENLVRAVQQHASPPESLREVQKPIARVKRPHSEEQRLMDFQYTIAMKNLDPVASIISSSPFNASGTLTGQMKGTDDNLSLTGVGTISEFFAGSLEKGVLINNATVNIDIASLSLDQTLENLLASADITIGKGLLNAKPVRDLRLSLEYTNLRGKVRMQATYDSLYVVRFTGQASVQPETYVFDFDSLELGLANRAIWHNEQDVQCRLNYEGIRVMRAVMRRGNEIVSARGIFRNNGDLDFAASLRSFDLSELGPLLRNEELSTPGMGFQGRAQADLQLQGTSAAPIIRFSLQADSVQFRRSRLGTVIAELSYQNTRLVVDASVKTSNSDSLPALTINGSLPVDLAFSGVKERFPNEPQRMEIRSNRFNMATIDPLIRELDQLGGIMSGSIILAGTPRAPEYEGSITMSQVSFLFTPTNIPYTMEGSFKPTGNRIVFENVVVRNTSDETLGGEARFGGSITMKNFQIEQFDITMVGQLLALSPASRSVVPTMYGGLLAATDENGLHLQGSLSRPFLSGKVNILDAAIVFPPSRTSEIGAGGGSLSYVVVNDTAKARPADPLYPRKFYSSSDSLYKMADEGDAHAEEPPEPSLLSRLRYNLTIETQGRTTVRMIFTPATNEELFAELEGRVRAVNQQGTPSIYGEIDIGSQSYYNFIRRFDASGKMKFVGPWDNPELEIKATYEATRTVPANWNSSVTVASTGGEATQNGGEWSQRVRVILDITGTRFEPQLAMSMMVQREEGGELVDWSTDARGGDVQSDAISFILTGKFKHELDNREQANIASSLGTSTGTYVVSGFTSNLLSGILDNFIRRELPFIQSVDVSYQEGGPNVSVGARPGVGYLRVGTRVSNTLGAANVSYLVNLGDVFNAPAVDNLFIEIQRRVESTEAIGSEQRETREARLYYRFSF